MACIHKFARGKNKGELCSKTLALNSNKCVAHSHFVSKKNYVVTNCLCGSTLSSSLIN